MPALGTALEAEALGADEEEEDAAVVVDGETEGEEGVLLPALAPLLLPPLGAPLRSFPLVGSEGAADFGPLVVGADEEGTPDAAAEGVEAAAASSPADPSDMDAEDVDAVGSAALLFLSGSPPPFIPATGGVNEESIEF